MSSALAQLLPIILKFGRTWIEYIGGILSGTGRPHCLIRPPCVLGLNLSLGVIGTNMEYLIWDLSQTIGFKVIARS